MSALLLESGDRLLVEDGGLLLLETVDVESFTVLVMEVEKWREPPSASWTEPAPVVGREPKAVVMR